VSNVLGPLHTYPWPFPEGKEKTILQLVYSPPLREGWVGLIPCNSNPVWPPTRPRQGPHPLDGKGTHGFIGNGDPSLPAVVQDDIIGFPPMGSGLPTPTH
jgi:hypothetical protein